MNYAVAQNQKDIEDSKHTLTFHGIRSHYQNGKVEKRIKIINVLEA